MAGLSASSVTLLPASSGKSSLGHLFKPERIGGIPEAIQILTHSPLIGRAVKNGKRELLTGRATRGYVALYRYVADVDTVFVLAVQAQLADGFKCADGLYLTDTGPKLL